MMGVPRGCVDLFFAIGLGNGGGYCRGGVDGVSSPGSLRCRVIQCRLC